MYELPEGGIPPVLAFALTSTNCSRLATGVFCQMNPQAPLQACKRGHFQCKNNECILEQYVCDIEGDCIERQMNITAPQFVTPHICPH